MTRPMRSRAAARRLLLNTAAATLLASAAHAASDIYLTPNISNPTNVTFGGQTFVNKGLVGAGRLSPSLLDFRGETLGSFSGMAVIKDTWRKTATGYTGSIYTLPDRGYNSGSVFSDYAARLNRFTIAFTPYTGSANLPASPASQNQLTLTPAGGFVFSDFLGQVTTGNNPGTGTKVENGFTLPSPATGQLGAGKISIDAEAVAFLNDGSFYVGDEYTGGVYYFDAAGKMTGYLEPEAALLPKAGTTLNFGADLNTLGRRTNQGMEGVSVTPDGNRLFAVLQSATLQDSNSNQETRNNTRVLVYDISQARAPANPIGHYVLQLPVLDRDGTGPNPDRAAAQSEILALNASQFLLLTRDGNGLGVEDNRPLVFKSVYLVDIANATNIAGTAFETGTTSVVTGFTSAGGTLSSTITPAATAQLVNLINPTQLSKLGFSTAVTPLNPTASTNRISEKWESMALLPVLEDSAPQDFFLFVGNDNDFATVTGCVMTGVANCNGPLVNDNVMMVWRLTLPTYVDPDYLDAMTLTGPAVMSALAVSARDVSRANDRAIGDHLLGMRHEHGVVPAQGASVATLWAAGSWTTTDETANTLDAEESGGTLGLDIAFGDHVTVGVAGGLYWGDAAFGAAFGHDYDSMQVSLYGLVEMGGFFADLGLSYAKLDVSDITRPSAYGLTAAGDTTGSGFGVWGGAGYLFDTGMVRIGPVAGARYLETDLNSFTETGASGGNILFPKIETSGWSGYLGGEASLALDAPVTPIVRLTYTFTGNEDPEAASLRLASATHALATQSVVLPDVSQDSVSASLMLNGSGTGGFGWYAGYGADIGVDDGVTHRLFAGLRYAM